MIYSSITEKIHPVPIHASQTVSLLSSEISHLRQPRPYSQHCIHDSLILIRVPPSGVWIRHLREVFVFFSFPLFCVSVIPANAGIQFPYCFVIARHEAIQSLNRFRDSDEGRIQCSCHPEFISGSSYLVPESTTLLFGKK